MEPTSAGRRRRGLMRSVHGEKDVAMRTVVLTLLSTRWIDAQRKHLLPRSVHFAAGAAWKSAHRWAPALLSWKEHSISMWRRHAAYSAS